MNNNEHISVCIKCRIVERVLEILSKELPIKKLSLNHVYYGSSASKKITLYNKSPVVSNFVICHQMSQKVNANNTLAMSLAKCEPDDEEGCFDTLFQVFPDKVLYN